MKRKYKRILENILTVFGIFAILFALYALIRLIINSGVFK